MGKTELTLTFTSFLMSNALAFRFDMSEYQTQESLGLLLGGKLGERGTLGMVYDRSKIGTLLFDEIEKAHPRVLDVFLQILDAARVTLATGETLELSGFYIVFTSNIGSADRPLIGIKCLRRSRAWLRFWSHKRLHLLPMSAMARKRCWRRAA